MDFVSRCLRRIRHFSAGSFVFRFHRFDIFVAVSVDSRAFQCDRQRSEVHHSLKSSKKQLNLFRCGNEAFRSRGSNRASFSNVGNTCSGAAIFADSPARRTSFPRDREYRHLDLVIPGNHRRRYVKIITTEDSQRARP